MYNLKALAFGATFTIVAMPATFAGGPIRHMPAAYGPLQPSYQLKLVASPKAGAPVVIALVDAAGRNVAGGQVEMVHAVYNGIKSSPTVQHVPETLVRDASGNFVCLGKHHRGEMLTFRGVGPAGSAPVWLTVAANS